MVLVSQFIHCYNTVSDSRGTKMSHDIIFIGLFGVLVEQWAFKINGAYLFVSVILLSSHKMYYQIVYR